MIKTKQLTAWTNKFGKQYTDRNAMSPEKLDKAYKEKYGVTRSELNQRYIGKLDRNSKILEVGSNIGNQMLLLQKMGFYNLYAIEPMDYAIERFQKRSKGINIIKGTIFDIPFKDNYFDLIFTSGVLVHISPKDIKKAIREIYRCSRKYIWGFEYYAKKYTAVSYRGEKQLLWKANYPQLYLNNFPSLELIKITKLKYLTSDNIDVMFLLKKNDKKN